MINITDLCRCGSIPSVIHHDGGVQIQCSTCHISGGWFGEDINTPEAALEKAIASWNRCMELEQEIYGLEDVK